MQKRHFCPFWGNFSFHFPSLSPLPPITDTRIPQSLLPTHCYCCCFFTSPCDAIVVGDEISFIFLSTPQTHLAPHLVHVRVVAVCNQVLKVCQEMSVEFFCHHISGRCLSFLSVLFVFCVNTHSSIFCLGQGWLRKHHPDMGYLMITCGEGGWLC